MFQFISLQSVFFFIAHSSDNLSSSKQRVHRINHGAGFKVYSQKLVLLHRNEMTVVGAHFDGSSIICQIKTEPSRYELKPAKLTEVEV